MAESYQSIGILNLPTSPIIVTCQKNNDNKESLTPVNTKMKVPDAIIGAAALVLDCNLITRNVSDFTMINGLKVIDPFSR